MVPTPAKTIQLSTQYTRNLDQACSMPPPLIQLQPCTLPCTHSSQIRFSRSTQTPMPHKKKKKQTSGPNQSKSNKVNTQPSAQANLTIQPPKATNASPQTHRTANQRPPRRRFATGALTGVATHRWLDLKTLTLENFNNSRP